MQSIASVDKAACFRHEVVAATAGEGLFLDSSRLWSELVAGVSTAVDSFTLVDRCYLVIAPDLPHAPLPERSRRLLEGVLLGRAQKELAFDEQRSNSTVAMLLRRALLEIGIDCSPAKAPLSLSRLVLSARTPAPSPWLGGAHATVRGRRYVVLHASLPDLNRVLSPAVREVVSLCAAGKTHAEIAARRSTSRRTVANQLAIAFQRLGISGRSELVHYLAGARASRPPSRFGSAELAPAAP